MMTSLSQEMQYVDCCQHGRTLVLMISNGLEDRRHLDNVGVILLSEYTSIFSLPLNVTKCNIRNTHSDERNTICTEVYIICPKCACGCRMYPTYCDDDL